jgi:glycosyltransferase involved in cell wall biosynthesis
LDRSEDEITVTPHGNYLAFRKCGTAAAPTCNDETPEFDLLFLGIKRNKGIEIFLEAMKQLQKTEPGIRALIAGQVTPGDEDLLNPARSLENVTVDVGYVRNDRLWSVFVRAGAVVLPYLRGTTSGAVHLAFAFCRPVIVSDLPCFEDIVVHGKNGLVVPRGEALALSRAMVELSLDPKRRTEMARAGFELEQSPRYDWDVIAESTSGTYWPR